MFKMTVSRGVESDREKSIGALYCRNLKHYLLYKCTRQILILPSTSVHNDDIHEVDDT